MVVSIVDRLLIVGKKKSINSNVIEVNYLLGTTNILTENKGRFIYPIAPASGSTSSYQGSFPKNRLPT